MDKLLYVTDCQKDFMDETGSLYVNGSVDIKSKIKNVVKTAYNYDMLIIGSMDAHDDEDDEFKIYPKHCVINTEKQDNIPEVMVHEDGNIYIVPSNGNGIDLNLAEDCWQIFFEKQTYNIWDKEKGQPDNLQSLLRYEDVKEIFVIGVLTNVCVLAAVKGFLKRKYKVYVIEDCIKGLPISEDNNEETAIKEMKKLGAKFIKSEDFEDVVKYF